MNSALQSLGGKRLLCGQLAVPKGAVNGYIKYVIHCWNHLQKMCSAGFSAKESVWANVNFKNKSGKSFQPGRLNKIGIVKAEDFYDDDGRIIEAEGALLGGVPALAVLEWHAVTGILRQVLGSSIGRKGNFASAILADDSNKDDEPTLLHGEEALNVNDHKLTNWEISKTKIEDNPFRQRLAARFNFDKDKWLKIDKHLYRCTIDTKLRSFLFKLSHGLLYANRDYFRFGHLSRKDCLHCKHENQTMEHLLLECKGTSDFRKKIQQNFKFKDLSSQQWLVGDETLPGNFFLAVLNQYIHSQNHKQESLCLEHFKAKLRLLEKVEETIAIKNNTIHKHLKKWEEINKRL